MHDFAGWRYAKQKFEKLLHASERQRILKFLKCKGLHANLFVTSRMHSTTKKAYWFCRTEFHGLAVHAQAVLQWLDVYDAAR